MKMYLYVTVLCHNICVKSGYYHNRKTSRMTIILFIFMSDIYFFCVCLMRDVLLLLSIIFYDLWVKLYESLIKGCEKARQKSMSTSEYKKLQYLT